MSHQEAGDPNVFPVSFAIPDDGDPRNASSVNVAFEALADRTAHLEPIRRNVPLNFFASVGSVGDSFSAAWDSKNRRWYKAGDAEDVRSSSQSGWTWSSSLVASVMAGENCRFIATRSNGDVVVSTTTRYVAETGNDGVTWTKVDVHGAATTTDPACIVFDPVHNLWCWFGQDSTLFGAVYTSSNRTTWTLRTNSLQMNNSWILSRMVCKPSTGRIVLIGYDGGLSDSFVVTSDDGGVTWTDRQQLVTVNSATDASLSYNAATDTWLYIIGLSSGPCEVWRSTDDGVTFTKILTLVNHCLVGPAPSGPFWVAQRVTAGDIVFSDDNGASWKYTGHATSSSPKGVFAGGGQLLALTATLVFPGLRSGSGGLTLT